jgi:hypothetical protein
MPPPRLPPPPPPPPPPGGEDLFWFLRPAAPCRWRFFVSVDIFLLLALRPFLVKKALGSSKAVQLCLPAHTSQKVQASTTGKNFDVNVISRIDGKSKRCREENRRLI